MKSKMRKALLFHSVLVIVSGLIALFAVEVTLMVFGTDKDRRVRIAHPPNFRQTRKHLEYEYDFITNSLGLRNVEISRQKPHGVARILLAGDSFVEGIGVHQDSTISAFLEREVSDIPLEVINGGLSGTGVFHHGRLARHVGYGLELDGLLFFIFDNDVFDAQLSQREEDIARGSDRREESVVEGVAYYLWPRTSIVASRAWTQIQRTLRRTDFVTGVVREAKVKGISEARIEGWKASVLPKYAAALADETIAPPIFSLSLVAPHFWSDSIDLDLPEMDKKFGKMIELLSGNIADARSRGIEVGVVYIPSKFQYDPEAHAPSEPWVLAGAQIRSEWLTEKTPIRKRLEAWAGQIGVPYLDTTPYYREATAMGERLTWRLDEHFNAKGNEYTATVIADWLRRDAAFGFLSQ